MAERTRESSDQRQERIQREQHRPEQNRGYDEAVRGGSGVADDRSVPIAADENAESVASVDDREAEGARQDVRRREESASRRASREP